MTKLKHGDQIKIEGAIWIDRILFHVDRWENWSDDHKAIRSLEKYNEIEKVTNGVSVFSIKTGYSITDNYPGKAEKTAAEKLAFENAVLVVNGETVDVEGMLYTVKVMGLQYSDPIHFIPV